MGYYSQFQITVQFDEKPKAIEDFTKELIKRLNHTLGFEWLSFEEDWENYICWEDYTNELTFEWTDDLKWYDYISDMKAISKEFPIPIFYVERYGEDRGDWTIAAFQNGHFNEDTCVGPVRPEL